MAFVLYFSQILVKQLKTEPKSPKFGKIYKNQPRFPIKWLFIAIVLINLFKVSEKLLKRTPKFGKNNKS